MRRIVALFLILLLLAAAPVQAESAAYVEDCAVQPGEGAEIRYYLPALGEAELTLSTQSGLELMKVFSARTLLGGLHVLRLEPEALSGLEAGYYTLSLAYGGSLYTATLTLGEPPAPAADLPAETGTDITPALRSEYRPGHADCYWCTPMDITDESAVWAMLTAPMTYVDIDQMKQALIYAAPDESSTAVAVVTGQSQGLHVLETLDNGWTRVETYSTSFFDSKVKNYNAFTTGYIQTSKLKTRQVNQRCGIVVDKLTQRLYFFLDGKLETTLTVSTGLYNSRQPYNETRSGEFMLISFTGAIKSDNTIGDYAIRYNAADYLHEVVHVKNADGTKNYKYSEPRLGVRASHGCIRVQRLTNADGYNMKVLYEKIKELCGKTPNVKLVIWEDYQGRHIPYPAEDTALYYNPDGGSYYHATANCPGVKKQYLPMTAFTYAELETGHFASLNRCPNCQPVLRKGEIDAINAEHQESSPGEIMTLIGK